MDGKKVKNFGRIHSHITGKILLHTTTRRKIPNIFGNWHMTFNSPLLNNEELINSPRVGNWNCLYCGELKSCYINSPRVEDWNSKILCAIWECQSFTKEKKGLGKILHSSLKAHSHSCARHNFSPLMAKQACGEKKVPTTCGFATRGRNFFSPRLLSHAVRKNCDLAQEWECAFRDSWGIFISPLVASPRRGEISHPFFSSVKDWVIPPRVTSAHDDFTEKKWKGIEICRWPSHI